MKLVRFGKSGAEKPGLVDDEGRLRDLSDEKRIEFNRSEEQVQLPWAAYAAHQRSYQDYAVNVSTTAVNQS
jgi:hypothetical protein